MARKVAAKTSKTPAPAAQPAGPTPEVVIVHSHKVACDGVGGALGHPKVFLEMGEADFVECPYCDRRFVLAGHGVKGEHGAPGVYEASTGH